MASNTKEEDAEIEPTEEPYDELDWVEACQSSDRLWVKTILQVILARKQERDRNVRIHTASDEMVLAGIQRITRIFESDIPKDRSFDGE